MPCLLEGAGFYISSQLKYYVLDIDPISYYTQGTKVSKGLSDVFANDNADHFASVNNL